MEGTPSDDYIREKALKNYHAPFLIFVAFAGSLGGFLNGYDTGIISGAQLYLKDTWPDITTQQKEMIVSLALLGAFFGAIISGPLLDAFGRKAIIMLSDVLFIVGSLMMAGAQELSILMVGRFIVGLGLGVDLMVTPLYLSEIAPV